MSRYERSGSTASPEKALLELELRTFTPFMPTTKNAAGSWVFGILLVIIVCRFAFTDRFMPEQIYALGAVLVWQIAYTITASRILVLPQNPFREWWLTIPLPRRTLANARLLGSLPFSGCFAAAIWLIATVHNVLTAAMTDSPLYAQPDRIIGASLAYAVLYAELAVLFTFVPSLITTVMQGWRQWTIIIFFILWIIPTGALGALSVTNPDTSWFDSAHAWIYAAAGLVLIPLAYRLCLHLIPKYGFQWIAKPRAMRTGNALQKSFLASRANAKRTNARGFRSLYALERSVFRNVSAMRWVRILYAIIVLGVTVGGYFALPDDEWVEMMRALIIFPGILTVTLFTLRFTFDMNKRRLEWVLGFPYSRLTLMLSRLLAVWVTAGIWMSGLAAGMTLGAAVRYVFDRPEHIGSSNAIQGAAYMIALFIVFIIFSSFSSILTYGYGNREWLGFVSIPLMMASYMWPMLFNEFIMPESFVQSGVSASRWIWLALLAAIGIPLSWGAFVLGSKGVAATMYLAQSKQLKRGIRTID